MDVFAVVRAIHTASDLSRDDPDGHPFTASDVVSSPFFRISFSQVSYSFISCHHFFDFFFLTIHFTVVSMRLLLL